MISTIRRKFGPITISIVIGSIAFVFIFFGVVSPKATRGLHEGSVAGTVNGEDVTLAEFNRELSRRMEFFKSIGGGKISEEQLKMFRVRDSVFQEITQRKLLVQEALHQGFLPSEEEIRDKIRAIDAFHKDGRFDSLQYKEVLAANRQTPAGFEKLVRDDLISQQWAEFFRERIKITEEEVRDEFLQTSNQRSVKYVLMTQPTFVPGKDGQPTQQPIPPAKLEENRKAHAALAEKILPLLSSGKGSDGSVNALVKAAGFEVKTSPLFSKQNRFIPGIGESAELLSDSFSDQSPIAGKAKKYVSGNWILVAVLNEVKKPDLAGLDAVRTKIKDQIGVRKERMVFETWLKKLTEKAKIDKNPSVVNDEQEEKSGA